MANRYSKINNGAKAGEKKSMQEYDEQRSRINAGARVMVIIVAAAMIVTTFLASGVFFLD